MSRNTENFDRWIRGAFVEMNTALEELYFAQDARDLVQGVGDDIKQALTNEGLSYIRELLHEGNTGEGFDSAFDLLGNVGLYFAALRRHEVTNPEDPKRPPPREASALAMHLGTSLGVTPRFATSHLATHNSAIDGVQKRFTSLKDELLFIDYNTKGILTLKRAADALERVLPLGASHPVAEMLLNDAASALRDTHRYNDELYRSLDLERFFFCVRPYYKTYTVGRHQYRGANAGDFSGVNEIDMLLGLCQASDPYYSQLLVDKMLFMMPEDQARLRDCMRRTSLLDQFLAAADTSAHADWFQTNAKAFLTACDAYGAIARQHHDLLVKRFIEAPARKLPEERQTQLTASGPPLPVLLQSLEVLRDLRLAENRTDIPSRYADFARLRALVGGSSGAVA